MNKPNLDVFTDYHPSIISTDSFASLSWVQEAAFRILRPDICTLFWNVSNGKAKPMVRALAPSSIQLKDQLGEPNSDLLLDLHQQKKEVLCQTESVSTVFSSLPSTTQIRTFVSIPFYSGNRVLGWMNMYYFSPTTHLMNEQKLLIQTLASHVANSTANGHRIELQRERFAQILHRFVLAIEEKDKYTIGHSNRVEKLTLAMLDDLEVNEEERSAIATASLLHDVGKLCLDTSALNNTKVLTSDELAVFRLHPALGQEVLKPIPFFANVIPMVYHHHEHFNGAGYPEKKKGNEIPLGARIITIIDSYDAMTSDRVYRKALSSAKAIDELRKHAGTQFDPDLVKIFLERNHKNR